MMSRATKYIHKCMKIYLHLFILNWYCENFNLTLLNFEIVNFDSILPLTSVKRNIRINRKLKLNIRVLE